MRRDFFFREKKMCEDCLKKGDEISSNLKGFDTVTSFGQAQL